MSYCVYCGTELQDDYSYCPKCGKKVHSDGRISNNVEKQRAKSQFIVVQNERVRIDNILSYNIDNGSDYLFNEIRENENYIRDHEEMIIACRNDKSACRFFQARIDEWNQAIKRIKKSNNYKLAKRNELYRLFIRTTTGHHEFYADQYELEEIVSELDRILRA